MPTMLWPCAVCENEAKSVTVVRHPNKRFFLCSSCRHDFEQWEQAQIDFEESTYRGNVDKIEYNAAKGNNSKRSTGFWKKHFSKRARP